MEELRPKKLWDQVRDTAHPKHCRVGRPRSAGSTPTSTPAHSRQRKPGCQRGARRIGLCTPLRAQVERQLATARCRQAHVYLHAWQVTENEFFPTIAVELLDYVIREMTDPTGGLYSR